MNRTTSKGNPSSKVNRVKPTSSGRKAAPQSEEDGGPSALSTLKKAQKTTRGVIARVTRKTDPVATRGAKARATGRRNATTAASTRNKNAPVRRKPTAEVTTMPMKSAPTATRRNVNGNRVRGATLSKEGSKSRTRTPTLTRKKSTSSISTKSTVKEVEKEKKVVKQLRPEETIKKKLRHGRRESTMLTASLLGLTTIDFGGILKSDDDDLSVEEIGEDLDEDDNLDPNFVSCYTPLEMRSMALVAHNHMKAPMKKFVIANQNLLKKFRLTGTNTTMTMLREVFGEDPDVVYGRNCTSGPLGGDAEIVQVMCTEELGACIFFQDPMSAHPHYADIECLTRQANVHNIIMMPNPSSAYVCMTTMRIALEMGKAELIPSFFETLVSPSVNEYKLHQARVLASNMEHENDYDSDHDCDEPF